MKHTKVGKIFATVPRLHLILMGGGVVLVIIALIVLAMVNKSAVDWRGYTSNQGGFAVEVPDGEMTLERDRITFMEKPVTRFVHKSERQEGTFRIIHFDLPPGVITPAERATIVNLLVADFLEPVNGMLQSTSETTVQGYEAMLITATGSLEEKEFMTEAVVVLISNRVYVAGYHGEKGRKAGKLARTFINSLQFNF